MVSKIIYWFDTHTMNPLTWPYVLLRSIQYKIEDILPKSPSQRALLDGHEVCPVCGQRAEITEQGLCENCGNIIL